MKNKITFHRLLHNNRLMLIFSLLASILIWTTVAYGPSNIKERTLKIHVDLDLTDTYADTIGLCILDNTSYDVSVKVEGKWSVISALSTNDINVRVDYSELKKAGSQPVSFLASYNSEVTDFDIVSVYPASVNVSCDYWETNLTYKVKTDLSAVTVANPDRYQLGDPVLDPAILPDETVSLEGPRSVTQRIESIVARVEKAEEIADVAVLPARLVALDAEGGEVDISSCKLLGNAAEAVNVTVPVWIMHAIDFNYNVAHMPTLFKTAEDVVTLSPASIVMVGPEDDLEAVAPSLANLGTFDFDNLLPDDAKSVIPLSVPASCTVLDGVGQVTVKLAIGSLTTKSYDLTLSAGSSRVVFENLPAGMQASIPQQTLNDILLAGKSYTLRNIAASDLIVTVDMSNAAIGAGRYEARVTAKGRSDVWTYYGESAHSFSLYVNVR